MYMENKRRSMKPRAPRPAVSNVVRRMLPCLGVLCASAGTPAWAQVMPGGPVSPALDICVEWFLSAAAGHSNVVVNHTGITGYERRFLIRHGDFDGANSRLDYHITYVSDPGECQGEDFILRFPMLGTLEELEIEVLEEDGDYLGSLSAAKGTLPVIYDQDGIELSTSVLGPFVINNAMMNQVDRILLFPLLDARILTNLPAPIFYNGAEPANWLQELMMELAYAIAVEEHAEMYTLFRFRRTLVRMVSDAQARAATVIDDHIYDTGEYAATVWEDHPYVDHSTAIRTRDSSSWGGFLNGHRHFLVSMEDYLLSVDDDLRTPFRRTPAWRSEQTVPADFDIGITNTSSDETMPTDYEADNICEAYDPSASSESALYDQLLDMQDALYDDMEPWHGNTHVDLSDDMGSISTAGRAPIFYPWHTTIDVVWQNWQLCWPAWDPDDYDWE